jgi:hypothetical protein
MMIVSIACLRRMFKCLPSAATSSTPSARPRGMIVTLCSGCVCLSSNTLTSAWPASCHAVVFFLVRHRHAAAFAAPAHFVARFFQFNHADGFFASARREQRGFVQQIRQFRAGITGRAARDDGQIHFRREFHVLGVNFQNRLASAHVRQIHRDLAVKTTGPQQRRIQHIRTVRRRDDDDAFLRVETVHLDEQRVQASVRVRRCRRRGRDRGCGRPRQFHQ